MTVGRGAAGGLLLQEERGGEVLGGEREGEKKHARQNIIRESCTRDSQNTTSQNIQYNPSPAVSIVPETSTKSTKSIRCVCVCEGDCTWGSRAVEQEARGPAWREQEAQSWGRRRRPFGPVVESARAVLQTPVRG